MIQMDLGDAKSNSPKNTVNQAKEKVSNVYEVVMTQNAPRNW